jgi:hypothetical protein
VLLGVVVVIGLVAYLGIRPHQVWILWLTASLAALAVDGVVRSNPRWEPGGPLSTAVYLLLPFMGTLGAGFFIDEALDGYSRTFAALVPAAGVAFVAYGEYHTVDYGGRLYGSMRLALAIATYLSAFALFTVIFTRDLDLPLGMLCTGLVSMALATELLRESRPLGASSLLVGLAVGVSLAEFRLALYFFPLDGLLAGALLIIGFYLATGLVHHLLDHDLEWETTAEYLLVAGVGSGAVIFTRLAL